MLRAVSRIETRETAGFEEPNAGRMDALHWLRAQSPLDLFHLLGGSTTLVPEMARMASHASTKLATACPHGKQRLNNARLPDDKASALEVVPDDEAVQFGAGNEYDATLGLFGESAGKADVFFALRPA